MSKNVPETRISPADLYKREGVSHPKATFAYLSKLTLDSICPALCSEGCEVEHDGTCEHGNPSVLMAEGLI